MGIEAILKDAVDAAEKMRSVGISKLHVSDGSQVIDLELAPDGPLGLISGLGIDALQSPRGADGDDAAADPLTPSAVCRDCGADISSEDARHHRIPSRCVSCAHRLMSYSSGTAPAFDGIPL